MLEGWVGVREFQNTEFSFFLQVLDSRWIHSFNLVLEITEYIIWKIRILLSFQKAL